MYIITDRIKSAIYGVGVTVDEAWLDVLGANAGPFLDAFGNEISDDEAYERYYAAYGASPELIDAVMHHGGDIAFCIRDGVASLEFVVDVTPEGEAEQ